MSQATAVRTLLGKDIDGNDVYAGDTVEMLQGHDEKFIGRVAEVSVPSKIVQDFIDYLMPLLMPEVAAQGPFGCTPEGNCIILSSSRKITEVH